MTLAMILAIYAFYLLFIVTMAAKAAWPELTLPARVLLAPAALVAVLMDVAFNITLATIIFADLPREALFTARLNRYRAEDESDWREGLAVWICRNLLDPFQSGGHCRA